MVAVKQLSGSPKSVTVSGDLERSHPVFVRMSQSDFAVCGAAVRLWLQTPNVAAFIWLCCSIFNGTHSGGIVLLKEKSMSGSNHNRVASDMRDTDAPMRQQHAALLSLLRRHRRHRALVHESKHSQLLLLLSPASSHHASLSLPQSPYYNPACVQIQSEWSQMIGVMDPNLFLPQARTHSSLCSVSVSWTPTLHLGFN